MRAPLLIFLLLVLIDEKKATPRETVIVPH
jgi:hypothetical protein